MLFYYFLTQIVGFMLAKDQFFLIFLIGEQMKIKNLKNMSYWTLPGFILASFGWESTFIGIMFTNVLKEFKPIVQVVLFLTLQVPDQICNSPYCLPYNSYNVSSRNLILDHLIIPKLIFFFILITYLVDIVLIL